MVISFPTGLDGMLADVGDFLGSFSVGRFGSDFWNGHCLATIDSL